MGLPSFCIIASWVGVYSAPSVPALEQIGTNWNKLGLAVECNHGIIVPSYLVNIDSVYMQYTPFENRLIGEPVFSFSIPILTSLTNAR